MPQETTVYSTELPQYEKRGEYVEYLREESTKRAEGKRWATLLEANGRIPADMPRRGAVRITICHDYLHIFRIGIMASPMCPLCTQAQEKNATHLDSCSALQDIRTWQTT